MATPNQLTPNPVATSNQSPTRTQTLTTPTPASSATASKLPIKRKLSPNSAAASDHSCNDSAGDLRAPPFKFQRIWSESDEIRFLQGLIGCKSQGLVFPRDLNLFYDQFSANMPQPYSRSQLSEKLRRLKNKHKSSSARIARKGLDTSRIAPHDRDVLHLCSRLWDPENAATSPFFSTTPGVTGNRRRRATPQSNLNNEDGMNNQSGYVSEDNEGNFANSSLSIPIIEERTDLVDSMLVDPETRIAPVMQESPLPLRSVSPIKIEPINNNVNKANGTSSSVNNGDKGKENEIGRENIENTLIITKAVLDVFDQCLREARMQTGEENGEDGIKKKWRELRMAELDVMARRMRLTIEDSLTVPR